MGFKKVKWQDIDPATHFRYAAQPLQGNAHDGKSIPLKVIDPSSGEEVDFIHQAPELYLPFGIAEKEVGNRIQYRSVFSFPTVRYDPVKEEWIGNEQYVNYYKWIDSIDKYNLEHVFKNMKTWFPASKQLKKEVLDEFYFSNTWTGEKCLSGEYSPTFTTKLMVRGETMKTRFFNEEKQECEYSEIAGDLGQGLRVIPVIKATGLWFAGKNFGMSYQVVQMLFYRKEQFVGCAIDLETASDCESVPRSVSSGQLMIESEDEAEQQPKKKTRRSGNTNVASNFNLED